ncbi:MAG: hypothetical protein JXJ22_10355 [Bacteroidales bacterium]|nr:hypothetical protein [Bacteroidales bacterium]
MRFLLLILFLCLVPKLFAVSDNYPSGARESGMANVGVMVFDVWSNYHNQAGLARLNALTLGFHYENRYAVEEYGLQSFAIAIPSFGGTIGFNYSFFGYSGYNENKIGLAFGKSFGKRFAGGIQIDGFYVHVGDSYRNSWAIAAEAGILAEPVDNLFIGAHIYNPTGSGFAQYEDVKIPVILQVGMGYQFSENLFLGVETEKKMDTQIVFKTAAEYQIVNSIFLRAGVTSFKISSYSFGVGAVYKRLKADIAFSQHNIMGFTPHMSMIYEF